MNGTLVFLIVVVAMFAGMALLGLGVFLYFFYRAVKRLTVVAEAVNSVIAPMAEGKTLVEMLKAFQSTNKMGKEIVSGLANITSVVAQFNRYYFQQTEGAGLPPAEPAATAKTAGALDFDNVDSFFIHPKEEEAVQREVAEELRKQGVETNEAAMPGGEVPLHNQVGADV